MKLPINVLFTSVIGLIITVGGVSAGSSTSSCKEKCKEGYECMDGVCKLLCGGESMNPVTCPNGYYCYGVQMAWDAPGHCEKLECGGIAGIGCKPGYWCDIVQTDISDGMGVCTNRKCPAGCAVWNDGCNTCSCSDPSGPICTEMACKEYGTPYCEKETIPPECDEIEAKFQKVQDGLVSDLQSLYNKLDDSHKKKFLDSIKNS